jgi:hypothetical protein
MALSIEERELIDRLESTDHIRNENNINLCYTTQGWKICLEWQDRTTSWLLMVDVKNFFPFQLAEYAVQNDLQKHPALWWVNYTLKKRKAIIKATKSTYSQSRHKFGIKVPKTVQEALSLDHQTGTIFWLKGIQKETTNNKSAFQFLDNDERVPVGYKFIKCHMIFDVKIDFARKARFVARGHMTDSSESITYSSIVSRDSIRITFLLAALNDVDITATDIGNAYLNALP